MTGAGTGEGGAREAGAREAEAARVGGWGGAVWGTGVGLAVAAKAGAEGGGGDGGSERDGAVRCSNGHHPDPSSGVSSLQSGPFLRVPLVVNPSISCVELLLPSSR